ncbi:MAG: hypothetical protein HFE91_12335 [Acutalibacter sp.]|jgi:3-oxoacyl-[acyl-carrier-protein] synthase-3|uniref:3-oxoacyl-ACP synthase III family protein n=1 Tax=Acutalibacter sp. TaxID=1918636 RepID=UPI00216BF0A4|nr:3-oxoacyl-[acyl-carrier-protein] synthase III C-terminal domain-containing protein [Acutalibacter sp.]MCI9226230.1 hypothetical protein [Acutalibacter sp.]
MAYFNIGKIRISGIANAVPDDVEYSEDYSSLFGEEYVKKFIASTGIHRRYTSHRNGVTASDLCCAAAEKVLTELNYDRSNIDALIYASSSRDYLAPVTACVLQDRLDLTEECICYDVPLGCTAYVYGLYLAALQIQAGCRSVLLLAGSASEQLPKDYVPTEIPMLSGDSGSATLIEAAEDASEMYGLLRSVGKKREILIQPYGGQRHPFWRLVEEHGLQRAAELNNRWYMDGLEVMRFSLREVVQMVGDFYSYFGGSTDDYDILACHQANQLILKNLARKIKFPIEKIPMPITEYANTGCGSVPLAICEHYTKVPVDREAVEILTCGFGIGLSLGIVKITVNPKRCFSTLKVSERFDDKVTYEKFH